MTRKVNTLSFIRYYSDNQLSIILEKNNTWLASNQIHAKLFSLHLLPISITKALTSKDDASKKLIPKLNLNGACLSNSLSPFLHLNIILKYNTPWKATRQIYYH
jgi:hypothetical protein